MQVIYFILAIVILVIWLGPHVLIILVLWAIALVTKGRAEVNNNSANKSVDNKSNNIPIKEVNTTDVPKNYFEITKQQGEKIQAVIDALMALEDASKDQIINRLQSFHLKYWEKNNVYVSDLYDYILNAVNERIGTAKRDFVKRECSQVIQIITLLKEGTSTDDIVRAILSQKEDAVNGVKDDAAVTDTKDSIKESVNKQSIEQSDDQQDNGWEVVENLENHPLRDKEYCQQLRNRVESLHKNGELDKEINFILETIRNFKSAGLPCRYWHLLLKVRSAEVIKKENVKLIAPTVSQIINGLTGAVPQIINGLTVNAIRREEMQTTEAESYSTSTDAATETFYRFELYMKNKDGYDICPTKSVPYWEHIYVYSVADLQNANSLQKQFYSYFKAQFLKERYLNIEDNSNYAFVLMFDLAEDYKKHKDYKLLKQQLNTLAENYPVVAQYINRAISQVVTTVNQEDAEHALQSYDKSRGQLCRWITPGETIEVQGIKLTRGNFYIGECFRLPDSIIRGNSFYKFGYKGAYIYGSVLNPDLPASNETSFKNYFCSYKDMSPAWRYEYLMWLSGKKQASDMPVEILLFYLYGCEIRMFIDPQTKKSERRAMLSEIIELYKSLNSEPPVNYEWSLRQKLDDFIGCAIVKYFRDNKEEFNTKEVLSNCRSYQGCYIAQKMAGKKALSPEDAFNIANEIYDIERLVPSGYISVARKYFMDDFSEGYKNFDADFEMTTTQVTSFCYYHNDCRFNSEKIDFYYTIDSLPSNLWIVHDIIRRCYWSVESKFRRYNRAKERSDGKETVAAIQLLPDDIDIREIPKIQTLITHIESEMQSNSYLVKPIDWLLNLWEYERKDEKSIHKEYADSIIGGLRRLGFNIVPDYEIDKKRFNFGDICVIYKNEEHYPVKSTTKYDRSDLFIKLASHIVLADKASNSDIAFIEQQLKSFNNTAGNHLHLMASIRWRFQTKKQPIDKRTQSIVATLTREQRTCIGNALIRLACINGDIHPKRIDSLKKVLPLLGIESENIHSQVHRLLTDSDGFAVVEKKSDAVEFTINGKPAYSQQLAATSVTINPKKLRIFEQQTKAAQELLSGIFVEEEAAIPQNMAADNTTSVWMEMLKLLLTKEVWERTEIEAMCKERGLMLGAVLEQINDFAYEKVDDAVVEDDGENIYVTLEYKEQLI